MIDGIIRRYETYKDCGNKLLPKLPAHWTIGRFNQYVFLKHGYQFRDFDFMDDGTKVVKITQLKSDGSLDLSNCSFIDSSRNEEFKTILIKENDILMALTGGTIGKIIRVPYVFEPLLQNYRVGNFYPDNRDLSKSYLFWILSSLFVFEQIMLTQRETGQPNVGKDDFKQMYIILPPLPEQKAIAEYLDKKTAQIDRKIDLLTRKAEKYTRLKQSLINKTVTHGLDKTVPMKDSGVEWIGKIPAHWQVKRLKELFTESKKKSDTGEEVLLSVSEYTGVTQKQDSLEENEFLTRAESLVGYNICMKNDLVINIMLAWKRGLGISPFDGIVSPSYCVYNPSSDIYPSYIHYLLRSENSIAEFKRNSKGIIESRLRLYTDRFYGISIALPQYDEQKVIADYLDKKTAHIDRIIGTINTQIEKLKELRKSLVNDVVTGKIKAV